MVQLNQSLSIDSKLFLNFQCCDDVLRYLRSARTHVPWSPDVSCGLQSPLLPQYSGLLQQRRSISLIVLIIAT